MSSSHPPAAAGPSISVVVCAYTMERLGEIVRAIESLRSQSRPPHQIVLVIDHSPELRSECRQHWEDVEVIENRERQGLSGARNTGLAAASGDVVAFLDDDAVAAPDWLERLADAYRDAEVVGVGGKVRPEWEEGRPGWFPSEFDWVVGCTHSGMPARTEPVRNLVGANMSFRRQAVLAAGGFRHELGRVGKIPAGCEETDLCIRINERQPNGVILYDPAAVVDHLVPAARGEASYFVSRCRGEGGSKAILARLVGSDAGLASERSYVRRTLPLGIFRDLRAFLGGDREGLSRAAMILVGLAATTGGYLGARRPRRVEVNGERGDEEAPLRILMVTPRSPLRQGGVERHVLEVSRRLAAAGEEVEVLCTEPGGEARTEEVRDGVKIRTVRSWPANRDYYLAPRIWREMSRWRPDVVHVQSYHTLVAPLAMLRALWLRIPYVVTFHGGGHSSEIRNRSRGLQRRLLRPLLARASRLVAIARFEVEEYGGALGLPPGRFAMIPNGTDLAFGASRGEDSERRNGKPLIASVGRLEHYKGHHRVIAAFPSLLEAEPQARLLIVGTGPHENDLRRQVEELGIAGQVKFTHTPPDRPEAMAELLGRVSLVALMSEFESHPLVALEAAAAGCKLVVADAGGLAEIAEDGLAKAIPLDSEPEEIAAALLTALTEPLPSARPQLVSWDECAAQLDELYRSVV